MGIWKSSTGTVRNGWKILLFFLVCMALHAVSIRIVKFFFPTRIDWIVLAMTTFVTLAATLIMLRGEGSPFPRPGITWLRELGRGFGLGALLIGVVALLNVLLGGSALTFAYPGIRPILYSLFFFSLVAASEELLFRGYLFQKLTDGVGFWGAQAILAGFFALAHWTNPGMTGVTRVIAMLSLVLAAIMFGLYRRTTGSLALPIGLHWSWNWCQEILGFKVSGQSVSSGFFTVANDTSRSWLNGGNFGPEAGLFALLVVGALVAATLRMQARKDPARGA